MTARHNTAALQKLIDAHAWPVRRPELPPVSWALDAGGKQLVIDQIQSKRLSLILEIGVFLGASAKVWLEASPDVVVIALDPWRRSDWLREFARQQGQPAWVGEQLVSHPDAFYNTFLTNMWEYRHRIIPIRALALDALLAIQQYGVRPDLVFLDADKSGRELEVCRRLFPQALLAGDDWFVGRDRFWKPDQGYPIRRPVRNFCRRHHAHLTVNRHTWLLTDEPLGKGYRLTRCRYHLKSVRRRFRGAFRWLSGRDRPDFHALTES